VGWTIWDEVWEGMSPPQKNPVEKGVLANFELAGVVEIALM